jgi:hypothetical protein
MPKGIYKGHDPMILVSIKTPANTNSTMPHIPVIIPKPYRTIKAIATNTLTILSGIPMFFFHIFVFIYGLSLCYIFLQQLAS